MATVVSLEGKRKAPSLEPLLALCADLIIVTLQRILTQWARVATPVSWVA